MDAVQLDMFADDPQNHPWLLSAIGEGVQNDCGELIQTIIQCLLDKTKEIEHA